MKIVALEVGSVGRDISFDCFRKYGELVEYDGTTEDQVVDRLADADIAIINKTVIDEKVLQGASKLKLVCLTATGFNNIDIPACKAHGVVASNVIGYSTPIVAQHTFAMLLHIIEHLNHYDNYVKSGKYSEAISFTYIDRPFNEISGRRYGIVGMGNIGRQTADIARAFGAEVVYYSASGKTYDVPYEAVDFHTLLTTCDYISLHCPLNEKTQNLFTREAFKKMKSSAILINVARGAVVCEEDLVEALLEGDIAGAGIDVFSKEPFPMDSPLFKLKAMENVILTPHIAWGSVEARKRCLSEICINIEEYLKGTPRNNVVN